MIKSGTKYKCTKPLTIQDNFGCVEGIMIDEVVEVTSNKENYVFFECGKKIFKMYDFSFVEYFEVYNENKMTKITLHENDARLLNANDLAEYLSVGKSTAVTFGKKANAIIKIGSRTLYDKVRINKYIDLIGD